MRNSPSSSKDSDVAHPPAGTGLGVREHISLTVTHAVVALLLAILSIGGLYRFGRFFGTIEWLLDHRRRRRFARAFDAVMKDAPTPVRRRRASREFFMQTRCDRLFYLIFDRIPRNRALALFSIENQDLLDAALARGHGVYLAMSHYGPLHVAAMLLALNGYKMAAVRDRQEGGMRRYIQDRFDRLYPEFKRMRVVFEDAFPREIYRCFQEEYILGSLLDVSRVRRENQKSETVTIFGEQRRFLTGPLHIALRCRSPILQAFTIPEPGFHYRFRITGMLIDPERVEDHTSAVSQAMQTYAAEVERSVRAHPNLLSRI